LTATTFNNQKQFGLDVVFRIALATTGSGIHHCILADVPWGIQVVLKVSFLLTKN
jgi:hypothetical protein